MNKALSSLLFTFALVLMATSAWGVTVSVRVSANNDDAEQRISDGDMYLDSTDLEFAFDDFRGGLQINGMRFQNVAIPPGALVNNAYVEFETDETDSGATNLIIFGQDVDDANAFTAGNSDITSRSKTAASVTWAPSAWNSVNQLHQTPDVASIIQEIIDRPGWSSGNDIVIIVEPGSGCSTINCQRTAESHDGAPAEAPLLVVDYSVGGGVSCDTFRDEFSTESYSRQDGTASWSSNWVENGDNGNASNGDIEISAGRLQLEGDGAGGGRAVFGGDPSIERQADLSSYTTATLSFDYSENGNWEASDDIEIWLSTDGGSSWGSGPIHTFNNDQGSATQSFTQDISAFISTGTRLALVEKANSNNEIFFFDNVQIEACTSGAPTVNTLVTTDRTPVITGTFNSAGSAGGFTVQVDGITYTLGSSPELTNSGDDWTLDLSAATPLAIGVYDVVATSDDGAGNVQSDTTVDELTINAPVCTGNFRDEFTSISFANNDGDVSFSGNWDEFEGTSSTVPEASPNPNAGHVTITGGRLEIQNFSPESPNSPGVERELDLSGYTSASFSFDFTTFGGVDNDDSILVQVSPNGGASWTLLENITGINDLSASRSYNLTPFINTNTRISIRVNSTINSGSCCYGAAGETIAIDNLNIAVVGPCMNVDHYAITHGGIGVTCEAETVVVTPHDNSHVAVAPTSSTMITLSTSQANDGWALKTGNGNFTPPNQYTFDGTETVVEFWLTRTTPTVAPHIDIDVTDGTATDPDDGGAEDTVLEFRDTALRFYADGVHNSIGPQIAGKASSVAPGGQTLTLRAVQTNTDTGACEARLTGTQTVSMQYDCVNPNACKNNNGVTITDTGLAVPTTIVDSLPGTGVDLSFDVAGIATWTLSYADAGQISLSASLDIAATGNDPAITLSGNSNNFVSSPAGLCVTAPEANSGCASGDANCGAFERAGEDFHLRIQAMDWQAAGESDTDFCAGNNVTQNFELAGLGIVQNLVAPGAGNAGVLGVASVDMALADDGDLTETNQNISEVGVFTFTVTPPTYFGETIAASTSANVGRFYPANFTLSDMQLVDRSDLGCASVFTYMDENLQVIYDLTAQNTAGVVTQNYTTASGFAKLNTAAELNYGAADITAPLDLSGRLTTGTPAISFVGGIADDLTDTLSLDRLAAGPDGSYILSIGIAPIDDDLVQLNTLDLDTDDDSINDRALIDTTTIHHGRQTISNSHSSELVPMTVMMRTEIYDSVSGTFIGNGIDSCTPFDVSAIDLSSAVYTAPLTATDLALTGSGLFSLGVAQFVIHSAGNSALGPGVTGDVTYSMAVPGYLQFDWDGDSVLDNPSTKATFGIFNGDSRQIYYRQIFR